MTDLEIEDKGRYLLRQPKEVDGSVQQSRLKLLFQINLSPILEMLGLSSHVHQEDNVNCELKQDREEDVKVENVSEGSLLG